MRIYINWKDEDVVTEKQYEALIEEKIEKLESDKNDFASWLNSHYSAYAIWTMEDDNLLDDILNDWHEWCADRAEQHIVGDWDEYNLPNE